MITLSDLIRKGAVGREQIYGALMDVTDENRVCALGAAIKGAQEAGLIPKEGYNAGGDGEET